MKKATLCFTFLLVYAASSMLIGQQVSINYNHNANFSQYHTYAWGSDDKNKIQNSILAQVAQQDIEAAMQQKGFQKVEESENPDQVLTASGGEREQTSYNAWGMRGIGGGMGGISPQQNVEATMVVSLYDVKAKSGLARNCSGHAEQERQQEPGDGREGRAEDVQAVAEVSGRFATGNRG